MAMIGAYLDKLEVLAQGIATPGESWAAARTRARRLAESVRICRPCTWCDPEHMARYRLPLGWIEGDDDRCRWCRDGFETYREDYP